METAEYERMFHLEDTHFWFVGKRLLAGALIRRYLGPGRGRVLDLGCGTGRGLAFLAAFGDPVGLDLSETALSYCRRRGERRLCRGSAVQLPFADGCFQLVTAFDVLYHRWVRDDTAVLREVRRVLAPGGHLLITDSALPVLGGPHDEATMARERYRLPALARRVRSAGLVPRRLTYSNGLLLPLVLATRLLARLRHGRSPHSDLRPLSAPLNALLGLPLRLEALLLPHVDLPIGSSVVCVARRG